MLDDIQDGQLKSIKLLSWPLALLKLGPYVKGTNMKGAGTCISLGQVSFVRNTTWQTIHCEAQTLLTV